jgi:GNAT superfamily N-acetyltransferase
MSSPPSPAVTIRPVGAGDAAVLAALHTESWRAAYRGLLRDDYLDGPIEPERRAVWAGRLAPIPPAHFGFVAEEAGRAVGFAFLFGGHDPRWGTLLDNLHVRPTLRGRGIGRLLVEASAEETGRRHPGAPLHLFVYERNDAARRFYASLGGREVERKTVEPPGGGALVELRVVWEDLDRLRHAIRHAGAAPTA